MTKLQYRTSPKIGAVFGKLTVKKRSPAPKQVTSKTAKSYWLCECECGKTLKVRSDVLLGGKKTHCGADKHKAIEEHKPFCHHYSSKPYEFSAELKGPDSDEYSYRKRHHLRKKEEFE